MANIGNAWGAVTSSFPANHGEEIIFMGWLISLCVSLGVVAAFVLLIGAWLWVYVRISQQDDYNE